MELGVVALAELLAQLEERRCRRSAGRRSRRRRASPSSVVVVISNRSRSSALPIDSPSGAAMKPLAMPPAVAASDDALAGAELVDRPVEDDQRQDVGSPRAAECSSARARGALDVPVMCTRASTPVFGISRVAVTSSSGLICGSPVNRMRAAAHQIEPAPLELVGAAHGVRPSRAGSTGPSGSLRDLDVAADRDVHVAEGGPGRATPWPFRRSMPIRVLSRSVHVAGLVTLRQTFVRRRRRWRFDASLDSRPRGSEHFQLWRYAPALPPAPIRR